MEAAIHDSPRRSRNLVKPNLQIGHVGKLSRIVDASQTITLGGEAAATVFSTPSMIDLMEHAAREALRPYLEAHEESVGIDVQVEHTAATPIGAEVWAEAKVAAMEKNVIAFEVAAFDASGPIGHGHHRRAVIALPRFVQKLTEKSEAAPSTEKPLQLPPGKTVKVAIEDRLATVTLHRPEKRNAINQEMTAELEQLTDWLMQPQCPVRVVIVSGAGGAFSAGDDVRDLNVNDLEAARALSLRRGRLYRRWQLLPQVLIASVAGPALGGGCICACACDLRIATHGAIFGLPEVLLGWPPNYGLSRMISLLGRPRVLQWALTGEKVGAREAESLGLVQEVVAEAQLERKTRDWAERLLATPKAALTATKRLLSLEQPSASLDAQATDAFLSCLASEDGREGIAAFLAKRSPKFNR